MLNDTPEMRHQSGTGSASIEGPSTIDALDRRTRPYKRYLAIRAAVIDDLGGEIALSEVQKQLVSKFATLALQLEVFEAAAMAGQAIDAEAFGRSAGHLRRLAEAIGLRREPRDVTPDLHTYLRSKEAAA